MSRKTNISKKPVVRDYGIQSYRAGDDKDYSEIIGTPTFFAANAATVIRESEYAKPYKVDDGEDYSSMEYPWPFWPGFDYPGIDYPGMDLPVPDFGLGGTGYFGEEDCSCLGHCYEPGETVCFNANCTYPIIGYQVVDGGGGFSISDDGKGSLCITASEGVSESFKVDITLGLQKPDGKGGFIPGGTCVVRKTFSKCKPSGCVNCGLAWDSTTSAETIDRSSSCTIAVECLDLPAGSAHTWNVSGTGFWFDAEYTLTEKVSIGTTSSITLYADASACGSASITVTNCLEEVTGVVRCTEGDWVLIDSFDVADCCTSWSGGICHNEEIVGKFKYYCGFVGLCNGATGCSCHNVPCLPSGQSSSDCVSQDTYEWKC